MNVDNYLEKYSFKVQKKSEKDFFPGSVWSVFLECLDKEEFSRYLKENVALVESELGKKLTRFHERFKNSDWTEFEYARVGCLAITQMNWEMRFIPNPNYIRIRYKSKINPKFVLGLQTVDVKNDGLETVFESWVEDGNVRRRLNLKLEIVTYERKDDSLQKERPIFDFESMTHFRLSFSKFANKFLKESEQSPFSIMINIWEAESQKTYIKEKIDKYRDFLEKEKEFLGITNLMK